MSSKSRYYTHGLRHKYIIFNQEWLTAFSRNKRFRTTLTFFMHLIYYGSWDRERVMDVRVRGNKYDIYTRLGLVKSSWDRMIIWVIKSGLLVRVSRARYKINTNIVLLSDDMNGSSLWEKPPEGIIEIPNYFYKRREKKIKDY